MQALIIIFLAIGSAMFIEGAVYALFPTAMKKSLEEMIKLPANVLRSVGLTISIVGFLILVFVLPRLSTMVGASA